MNNTRHMCFLLSGSATLSFLTNAHQRNEIEAYLVLKVQYKYVRDVCEPAEVCSLICWMSIAEAVLNSHRCQFFGLVFQWIIYKKN